MDTTFLTVTSDIEKTIKVLFEYRNALSDILLATAMEGDKLKKDSEWTLEGHRAYTIYLDNARHLSDALEGIKTTIGHLELIRTDVCDRMISTTTSKFPTLTK